MFDTIKIQKRLTIPKELKNLKLNWKDFEFQTKDLENCLLNYYIDKNGELWEEIVERKYIYYTEEEKKKLKPKPWNLFKDVIETKKEPLKINHHGIINFYTYEEFDEETDFWLEYEAYFVYGKLDKIKLKNFYTEKTRKESLKEWQEKIKKEENKPWNIFKKHANKIGWNWFWRKTSNHMYTISDLFSRARLFILQHIA